MSVRRVKTNEARARLCELIRDAAAGHDVVVTRRGQPVAKTIPWPPARVPRIPGSWAGRIDYGADVVTPDEDVVAMFDESADAPST